MARTVEVRVSIEPFGERWRATLVAGDEADDFRVVVVRTDERDAVIAAVQQAAHDVADALGARA